MADTFTIGDKDAPGGASKHLVTGDCIAIVESIERKSGKKADYLNCCLRVVGQVSGDGRIDVKTRGNYLYDMLSLSAAARWRLGRLGFIQGHDAGDGCDLDSSKEVRGFFCDREAVLTIVIEDDGQYGPRARWNGDGRRLSDVERDALKKVYTTFGTPYDEAWRPDSASSGNGGGDADRKWGGGGGGGPKKGGAEHVPGPPDDDIPF